MSTSSTESSSEIASTGLSVGVTTPQQTTKLPTSFSSSETETSETESSQTTSTQKPEITTLDPIEQIIRKLSQKSLRSVTIGNETCYMPRQLDTIYFAIKENEKYFKNIENTCPKTETIMQSLFNEPTEHNNQKKTCLSQLFMASEIISPETEPNNNEVCRYIVKDLNNEEICYCNNTSKINITNVIPCICEMRTYDYRPGKDYKILNHYIRKNCTVIGTSTNEYYKWISNCTLTENKFPFEDIYFNLTDMTKKQQLQNQGEQMARLEYQRSQPQYAYTCSLGNNLKDPLSNNYILSLLLLLFHLFLYSKFFNKQNLKFKTK